jgi:hypothetical protein
MPVDSYYPECLGITDYSRFHKLIQSWLITQYVTVVVCLSVSSLLFLSLVTSLPHLYSPLEMGECWTRLEWSCVAKFSCR